MLKFPELSEKTNSARVRFLKKKGIESFDDWKKLSDAVSVVNSLSPAPTTRKTEMFHIIGYLKQIPEASDLLNEYNEILPLIIKNADIHSLDTSLDNDPRRERYINLENLREAWKKLPDDLDKVMLSLYINEPPQRNVYYDAKIVSKKSDVSENRNNIIITSRSIRAYCPKHKTARQYGPIDFAFTKETSDLIRKVGFPQLKEDGFKKRLRNVSQRVFGQPITIDSYRHIWETALQKSRRYHEMSALEREREHNKIYHGTLAALRYNRV